MATLTDKAGCSYDMGNAMLCGVSESGNTGAVVYKRDESEEECEQYPYVIEGYYLNPHLVFASTGWLTAKEFQSIAQRGIGASLSVDM